MSAVPMQALLAMAALLGLVVIAAAGLRAWRDWLDFQRQALARGGRAGEPVGSPAARIELADLRERVRRLEAIAAGVDL